MLLDVFVAFLIVFLAYEGFKGVSHDYFYGVSYCPGLSKARGGIARLDMNLFYYFKNSLAIYCNIEDSFWRLIMDTWLRGLLTGTDSWLLLISTFPFAFVFEELVRMVLAPAMGLLYAILVVVLRRVEDNIPYVEQLQFLKRLSIASTVQAEGQPPPPTLWRKRSREDPIELTKYFYNRQLRAFNFYRGSAQAVMSKVFRGIVWYALFIRVACLIIDINSFLVGGLHAVGLGRWIEAQRTWFAELAGYSELKKDAHFTDKLLMLGVRQVTHHAGQLEYEGTKDVIFSMLKGLAIALWPLAKRLFIPAVILVPLCIKFRWTIMAEQVEFKKRWKEERKSASGAS